MDMESRTEPDLDECLLARIAEDRRMAAEAAAASGRGREYRRAAACRAGPGVAEHVAR